MSLVTSKEIFEQIISVNKINSIADLEKAKTFLFESGFNLKSEMTSYLKEFQFTQDPEQTLARLMEYHEINGGLVGLATALEERATSIYYRSYSSSSDPTTKKIAQGDRKIFADGDTADIKGAKSNFEQTQRNIWERISFLRGRK